MVACRGGIGVQQVEAVIDRVLAGVAHLPIRCGRLAEISRILAEDRRRMGEGW